MSTLGCVKVLHDASSSEDDCLSNVRDHPRVRLTNFLDPSLPLMVVCSCPGIFDLCLEEDLLADRNSKTMSLLFCFGTGPIACVDGRMSIALCVFQHLTPTIICLTFARQPPAEHRTNGQRQKHKNRHGHGEKKTT